MIDFCHYMITRSDDMRNKDFDHFMKTGKIIDYLNYKKKKVNGVKNESKGRDCRQSDQLPR